MDKEIYLILLVISWGVIILLVIIIARLWGKIHRLHDRVIYFDDFLLSKFLINERDKKNDISGGGSTPSGE